MGGRLGGHQLNVSQNVTQININPNITNISTPYFTNLCSAKLISERIIIMEGTVVPGVDRVVEGGLAGLQGALEELKKGVSGEKLVVEV